VASPDGCCESAGFPHLGSDPSGMEIHSLAESTPDPTAQVSAAIGRVSRLLSHISRRHNDVDWQSADLPDESHRAYRLCSWE